MSAPLSWYDRAKAPITPQPQASKFAEWVFESSILPPDREPIEDYQKRVYMKLGSDLHRDIELFLQSTWTENLLGRGADKRWSLYFVDRDDNNRNFTASRLRVKGNPLRCRPDLVLENKKSNEFLIIERKTTFVPEPKIPRVGWPNVEAQLWCYSWIDEFKDANEVILIGQLWRRRGPEGIARIYEHPNWLRSESGHDERCQKWFDLYSGKFRTF